MRKNILCACAAFVIAALSAAAAFAAASTEDRKDLLPLGSAAPAFSLPNVVTGKTVSLDSFADKDVLVVAFICRHCPFVQRVKQGLVQFGNDYADKKTGFVTISSNDASAYSEDAPGSLKEMAEQEKFPMPLLYDETQATAKAYTAVATPDIFVFDKERKLVYRGQFDDARPGNDEPVTGKSLRAAVDAVLAGQPVPSPQKPAIGCGIKWKK
jgi:peroxiredoxin